ncbi:MAG: hypothetical protein AB1734_10285, partial [Elusimicrobiota bacterium]
MSVSKRSTPSPVLKPLPPAKGVAPGFRHAVRTVLHLAADAAAVVLAYYAAYSLRFQSEWLTGIVAVSGKVPEWMTYQEVLYAVVPLWLMIFWY